MSYRFTVVMTLYRRVPLLLRAVYSVLAQCETSWELIIVADGRHPLAEEMVFDFLHHRSEYQDRISYMTVIRKPGHWGNSARRQGLLRARGEYTCFIGHDCLLASSYLATHQANLECTAGPALSVVGVEYWRVDGCDANHETYRRTMPKSRRPPEEWIIGDLDLTCVAYPTQHAIRLDVFAGEDARKYEADVTGFLTCREELPVVYNPVIVAAHF